VVRNHRSARVFDRAGFGSMFCRLFALNNGGMAGLFQATTKTTAEGNLWQRQLHPNRFRSFIIAHRGPRACSLWEISPSGRRTRSRCRSGATGRGKRESRWHRGHTTIVFWWTASGAMTRIARFVFRMCLGALTWCARFRPAKRGWSGQVSKPRVARLPGTARAWGLFADPGFLAHGCNSGGKAYSSKVEEGCFCCRPFRH
jgi:hypothetical protein